MDDTVLQVSNLSKTFPKQQRAAVADVSFSLHRGEILGLLGPNGAGKTTTIQMLLGTLHPSIGGITYFGENFLDLRSEILQQIGFASTYSLLPEHLSVEENLKVYGLLQGISTDLITTRIDTYLERFRLTEKRKFQFGALSAGQRTRVLLAKAFLHNPAIVLLDEPTAALDPDVAEQIRSFILEEQKQRGLSVFFTSHNMHEVSYMCNRVIVLKDGHLIADDSPRNLAQAVSTCRIHLTMQNGFQAITAFAQQANLSFSTHEDRFSIVVDEHNFASLLSSLASNNISYTHISIDKPTLDDYFIKIAQSNHHGKEKS